MGQVIKIDFFSLCRKEEDLYEKKLIRIRDEIEDYLNQVSLIEKDDLAVALAAGRYASMRLYQMQGRAETMAFFDNCIQTVEIAEDISKNKK